MRKALVAANWKMHGSLSEIETYLRELQTQPSVETVLLPPSVFLSAAIAHSTQNVVCGVQDIGVASSGAHTGELAAEMVAELGGRWVIVGHSERRQAQAESDELVALKAAAAFRGGLLPIVCVGETLAERQAGQEQAVVERQLSAIMQQVTCAELSHAAVGYEPVWAIGTGETASPEQAQQMHAFIRAKIAQIDAEAAAMIRIVYGGSVKPGNAAELFAQVDIDGGLVGGASLNATDFSAIIAAAEKCKEE